MIIKQLSFSTTFISITSYFVDPIESHDMYVNYNNTVLLYVIHLLTCIWHVPYF